jgi:WD40 repeat protein
MQVFSLDYGEKLRVYDTAGKLRSSMRWSSKVRCIAVGDVEGEGDDALVGGVGKRVLVISTSGKPLMKIDLESSVVACDARDVDGDNAAEVAVALQNKRIILLNDDQNALFSYTVDSTVSDIWLEDITNDSELEVVIAEHDGLVKILSAAGYELKRLRFGDTLTVFSVLTFGKKTLFVTGDHSSTVRIWDIDGNEVGTIDISAAPMAMACGTPDDVSDTAHLVIGTRDRKISFWQIRESARVSRTEKRVLKEIESTKQTLYRRAIKCGNCGAPVSPESTRCPSCGSALEMLDEYEIEEFIQESIESITLKHNRIKLKELDRILRRTLPRPAAYNLQRALQTMIQNEIIDGHIDGNTFVRTEKFKAKKIEIPDDSVVQIRKVLTERLKDGNSIDIQLIEKESGVDRSLLRRALLILLGEEKVKGMLSEGNFILDERENTKRFINHLLDELRGIGK